MRVLKIFIMLLLNSVFLFGQETKQLWKNQIKFSPLRIIELVNPGFEISFEKAHSKNISSQIS